MAKGFSLPCRQYSHCQSLPPADLTSRNKPPPSESFQSRSVGLADLTLVSVSRFSGIVGLHGGESTPTVEHEYPQRYPRIFQTSMNNSNAQQTVFFLQTIDFKRGNMFTKRYHTTQIHKK